MKHFSTRSFWQDGMTVFFWNYENSVILPTYLIEQDHLSLEIPWIVILGRNGHRVLQSFQWWFNIDQFLISILKNVSTVDDISVLFTTFLFFPSKLFLYSSQWKENNLLFKIIFIDFSQGFTLSHSCITSYILKRSWWSCLFWSY